MDWVSMLIVKLNMKALKLKFQLSPIVSLETIKVLNPMNLSTASMSP